MGFGGSVLAMILSLKNNARRRKKPFETIQGAKTVFNSNRKLKYKTVSDEKLEEVKEKIRNQTLKENRRGFTILMVVLFILAPLIFGIAFQYNRNVREKNAEIVLRRKEHLEKQKREEEAFKNQDAKYFLGEAEVHLTNKDYEKAYNDFTTALIFEPENSEARIGRIETLVNNCIENNSNCPEARKLLDEALNTDGKNKLINELKKKLEGKVRI